MDNRERVFSPVSVVEPQLAAAEIVKAGRRHGGVVVVADVDVGTNRGAATVSLPRPLEVRDHGIIQ